MMPGRLGVRPVYAPALVAFLGGGSSSVTWFPLAPGEAWQPPYRTSPAYLAGVNPDVAAAADQVHVHQRSPQALTSVAASDFQRGRPAGAGWLRIAANLLANAQVVPPPAMPDRTALAQARASRVPVTAPASVRQVVADAARPAATPRPAPPGPTLLPEAAPPPPRQPVARAASPAAANNHEPAAAAAMRQTTSPPARAPKMAAVAVRRDPASARASREAAPPASVRAPAPVSARPSAAEAPQAKAAARQRTGRQLEAKRALAARVEGARRDQIRAAELTRREATAGPAEQLQRQEQSRRAAVARREEQLRRQAHARHVEQARRAEQDREQAERAAWQRAQQATTEQWRRDHDAWEQRQRPRGRPDLRSDPRYDAPAQRTPEVWQRGIPLLAPGRTS